MLLLAARGEPGVQEPLAEGGPAFFARLPLRVDELEGVDYGLDGAYGKKGRTALDELR